MLTGGCFCGDVRYEAGGTPIQRTLCHCTMCRGTSGAPCVAWFSVPRAQFRFVQGEPTRFASSPRATRCFCPRCGSQLTFASDGHADEIDVTTCTLDDPEALAPEDHTFVRSRLGWVKLADGLPEYPQSRP